MAPASTLLSCETGDRRGHRRTGDLPDMHGPQKPVAPMRRVTGRPGMA
jgi:hypothetical protein